MIEKTTIKKFIIRTQDKYGEKTFEIVKGINLIIENLPKQYSYKSKLGNCDLIFNKDLLTILRIEKFDKVFSFDISFSGIKNRFIYQSEFINEEFFTQGEKISYDEIEKIFTFSYKLLDKNDNEINRIEFSIKEI